MQVSGSDLRKHSPGTDHSKYVVAPTVMIKLFFKAVVILLFMKNDTNDIDQTWQLESKTGIHDWWKLGCSLFLLQHASVLTIILCLISWNKQYVDDMILYNGTAQP